MRSLKLRLLVIITIIVLASTALGGRLIIRDARETIVTELESRTQIAVRLLAPGIPYLGPEGLVAHVRMTVAMLDRVRHLRVSLGKPQLGNRIEPNAIKERIPDVPMWFIQLVYPEPLPHEMINVMGTMHLGGTIYIVPDPSYKIREVWLRARDLFGIGTGILFCVGAMVYLSVWRGLRPLKELRAGFGRLERGNFDTRVPENTISELVPIHRTFNQMAGVLRESLAENRMLARNLVDVQEQERRRIARELHDEMAPLLFQIRVDQSTINQLLGSGQTADISPKLESINTAIVQLQDRVRRLLRQLRPPALDELGLTTALKDLAEFWRVREPDVQWNVKVIGDDQRLDDTLRVTIFRIVQECLTNIARHADARQASVVVTINEKKSKNIDNAEDSMIAIVVHDDGEGMTADTPLGQGLVGVRERVHALGGKLIFNHSPGSGLRIEAYIPV